MRHIVAQTSMVRWLTAEVIAKRFALESERKARMAIKWNISAQAMKARSVMDQISAEYAGFITDGTEHLGDIKGLRSQVGEMKTDLYAAANIMGNGSGNGSPDSQPSPPVSQNPPPAIQQPPAPISEPVAAKIEAANALATMGPPAVGSAATFPGT